ncbi:hypothetical protein FQR65_LT09980 [Abscondita terminalis]|nr:hypothetical protein FQR65_LT09980 [Abscondita terminalis]
MKIIVLFLFVFVALSTQDKVDSKYMQIFTDCAKENNITPEQTEEMKKHNFPNVPNIKCFFKCCMVKLNTMNADTNAIDYDKIIKMEIPGTTTEMRTEIVNACKNIKKSNGCELAYEFSMCCFKHAPKPK